jgi:hypothetical protein
VFARDTPLVDISRSLAAGAGMMRCMMWCMRRTNIYLDEEQTASLDRLAEQEGISRAELIRRLIDRALTGDDASRAADLVAIEESFGTVGDLESALREAGDREEHLARIWRREQ